MKNKIIKQIVWFLSICLPITYAIGIYIWNKEGLSNPINRINMYIPALTIIGLYFFKFKKPIFKNSDLGFSLTGFKYWIIAPIFITLISFISYGISILINPNLIGSADEIVSSLRESGFYWGNISTGLVAIILINAFIGSLINIPMFLGEELGWRAFLQPRLLLIFKPKMAFVLGGTIWGLWHLIMVFQGLNYPDDPVLGIFLMILFCIPLGIIIQYFYYKSKSIFVAALMHGALNKSAMSVTFILSDVKMNSIIYGPTGLIGILIFWIVAIILFSKIKWETHDLTLK